MLEEGDLDIMARINAQNDEKDRENAELAAASKRPGCATAPTSLMLTPQAHDVSSRLRTSTTPAERSVVVVSSGGGLDGFGSGAGSSEASERSKLDPKRVASFW